MRKRNIQHTTPANRSVFYDLEFDEAEARVLAMRLSGAPHHQAGVGRGSYFAVKGRTGVQFLLAKDPESDQEPRRVTD